MTIPERAAEWAKNIALDNSHGYDQSSRWGPDYDCSSLCIRAYQHAGVPLTCTYTGNMRANMLDNGFIEAPGVNKATGAGLQTGDVLLNVVHHAAIYIGGGKLVNAGGNEKGGTTGGQTGDQTGKEIMIMGYYNYPWDYVLRYARKEPEPDPTPTPDPEPDPSGFVWYTVRDGDTLWGISEFFYGTGLRYTEIMAWNGLTDAMIFPGQMLKIYTGKPSPAPDPDPDPVEQWVSVSLPVLHEGDSSLAVQAVQYLLTAKGYYLTDYGCDGELGEETMQAVKAFQEDHGVSVSDTVDEATWYALILGE